MRLYLTLSLLFSSFFLFAQTPVNDDCSGLIDLGQVPSCSTGAIYDNVNATASDIGYGNNPIQCGAAVNTAQDVWFQFTTSDTIVDYSITITGLQSGDIPPIQNPTVIIYRGGCQVDGLLEIRCQVADDGATSVEMEYSGLSLGTTYFLRIFDANGLPAEAGAFELCIDEIKTDYTITDSGSTANTGTIYDSGGDDGNYGDNENEVFTICPSDLNNCLIFTLQYYNIELGDPFFGIAGDALSFYDGPDTNSPLITSIGASDPYDYYIFNTSLTDGGVCFPVVATSGCMTIEFTSDDSNNLEGFAGSWTTTLANCPDNTPITIDENIDESAIEGLLSSPESTVTVKSITCGDGAYGTFSAGDNSDLGLTNGLLLSSGFISDAIGPNDVPDAGGFYGGGVGNSGDADLDILSNLNDPNNPYPELSFDACVVELEIFAATNELTFEYVFGSEEYPEYVNGGVNDIFAFFISGPGITGIPELDGKENIAVLPNSDIPVEINSVNNVTNWQYYRNNNTMLNESTQFDGLTSDYLGSKKSLTARAVVDPCNTYTLKLAIADRGDDIFNSGVFIGEISGGKPEIEFSSFFGIDNIIESCTNEQDSIVININGTVPETVTYQIQVSGTATRDVDYTLDIPTLLTVNPGDTEFSFPIAPIADGISEDTETIIIDLIADFGCGSFTQGTVTIDLMEELDINLNIEQDSITICGGGTVDLISTGASEYYWTPLDIVDNPIADSVTITPTQSTWVYVNGEVGLCQDIDSVYISVMEANLEIAALSPTGICFGESIDLQATTNIEGQIVWSPESTLNLSDPFNPIATPDQNTTYGAIISDGTCEASASISVEVDQIQFPNIIDDTSICLGESIALGSTTSGNTFYQWTSSPTDNTLNANSSNPNVSPTATTTYTLTATSTNGFCPEQSDFTTITVHNPIIQLAETEINVCDTETPQLQVVNAEEFDFFSWTPSDGLSCTDCPNPIATIIADTTTYMVTAGIEGCMDEATVTINTKTGVELSLSTDPAADELYFGCEVEVIVSNESDSSIIITAYDWNLDGVAQNTTGDNISFFLTDNHIVQVSATADNACIGTDELAISPQEPNLTLPNIVTPNGDELNEYFNFIEECEFPILRFDVYNRWGQLVYQNDTPSTGWDGRYNNEYAPQDVYLYIIEVQLPTRIETYKGDLTILR